MPTPGPDHDYAITAVYDVSDDAWCLELDLLSQHRAVVVAVIPDEEPEREPTVSFDPRGQHLDIPYDVMRWFMGAVEKQIDASRAWMRLRPELVELIRELRERHGGYVDDDEFPHVAAQVRAAVPEADVADVLAAAVERNPDGSAVH